MDIPAIQQAWQVVARGTPRKALVHVHDLPVPSDLNQGDVLVKVQAAALNPVGYNIMRLVPNLFAGRPAVAEYDFSGIVVDANGSHWSKGDAIYGMIRPLDAFKSHQGALSQYTIADSSLLSPRPDLPTTTPTKAAGIAAVAVTAYQCLFDVARFEPGQALFVNGGSTAVGAYAIQFAKAVGARRVVASASGKNRDYVLGLGADEFIDYTVTDIATALAANPPAGRFNVVFDAAGLTDSSLYAKSPAYLAPGGMFVTVGPQPTSWRDVPRLCMLMFHLVRPVWLGGVGRKWKMTSADPKKETMEAIHPFIAEGRVKPPVDSVYAFDDVFTAYDRLMSRRATGKVVVKVDPTVD